MSGIWEKRQTGFPSPSREGDPSEEPGHRGNEGDRAERPVSAGSLGEDKDGPEGRVCRREGLAHPGLGGSPRALSRSHPAVRMGLAELFSPTVWGRNEYLQGATARH